MFIYTIIAYSALLISIITFIIALNKRPVFYWISALSIYIFSFLGGFSIGQLTVGLTFIPLSLAIASMFGWTRNKIQNALFAGLGFVVGFFMVILVGNTLFYPIFIFLS